MQLLRMRVTPVNCQVVLFVPDAEEDLPEWPTGRELVLVVANSGTIYVSTQCDVDGEVHITVWVGEEPPEPHREPIYDGTLLVRDAGALVGSFTGNQLGHLAWLREGPHRVRVYTDPAGPHAEYVSFVID